MQISTCIAFAALMQKDTKLTTGLRSSGVGGCVCARHKCVRANGMGNLQKGERYPIILIAAHAIRRLNISIRYANMDYVVFSALVGIGLLFVTISYDIVCQWKQNVMKRMSLLPPALHLDTDTTTLKFGLPVWHAGAHEPSCQASNLLGYVRGVGCADGEGIERTWSVLNPAMIRR